MNRIKLVCLDWSGVISDDRIPVYKANMLVLQEYSVAEIAFQQWLEESPLNVFEFYQSHGIQLSNEEAMQKHIWSLNQTKGQYYPTIYPQARSVLDYLHSKYQLAIISSHPQEHLQMEMQIYGIDQNIFSNIEANARTKAPAMLGLLEKMQYMPEQVIYVADTIHDIQAAKEAGIRIISKSDGYHSRNKLMAYQPDFIIEQISELQNIL